MVNIDENEIVKLESQSLTIEVVSKQSLDNATACIKGIKSLQNNVKESFDPIIDQAHKSHKEAINQRDKYLKPLLDIEKRFKQAILNYTLKLEAEQRERERIANEQLAKVAEEVRDRVMLEMSETNNCWNKELLKEQAESIKPITVEVQKMVVESAGLSIRKTWKARVIDFELVPREYLLLNEPLLNGQAKIEEVRKTGISGIEFYEEASASVRS